MTPMNATLVHPLNTTSEVAPAIEEPLTGEHLPPPIDPGPQDQPIGWTAWSG